MRMPLPTVSGLTVAVAAATLMSLATARPASAQIFPSSNPKTSESTFAIRGGVFFPLNSSVNRNVGRAFAGGGLDYVIQRSGPTNETIVSIDYIRRDSAGSSLRVIPVTVGQINYSDSGGSHRTFTEYGAGLYFVNQTLPDQNNVSDSKNQTAYGGYIGAGIDLTNHLFLDARYHAVTSVGSVTATGIEVTAGIRF